MVLQLHLDVIHLLADINAALGTATATDACGAPTVYIQVMVLLHCNIVHVHKQEHLLQEMLAVILLLHHEL